VAEIERTTGTAVTLVYDLDHDFDLPQQDLRNLVGGKAAGLNEMATKLKLPVPPGFVVTTEACKHYLDHGWPQGLEAELREHMARTETLVGRLFGGQDDSLLVSVRSGAPISMPGMMDTILNLGLNDGTVLALGRASGNAAFAEDSYRRFRKMYLDIVGVQAPADPWLQLRGAVEAVFRSWNGQRARDYRRHENISDDLGTAVTIMTMVFGNRGADSATGVLFTRDPATGRQDMYGDVMFNAQGEDVVAGTHETEKIAVLDIRLPEVARELKEYASILEHHFGDMCDIEFTIEQGRLWMLQERVGKRTAPAALRMAVEMAEDPDFPLTRAEAVLRVAKQLENPPLVTGLRRGGPAPLATGLNASPGVAHGEIVTSTEAAEVAVAAGRKVILVREATSPDDVHGMEISAGILTSKGGLNSHAAVVARGWGIPAVVGAKTILVRPDCIEIDGRILPCGELITIDGSTGEVFTGEVKGSTAVAPEVPILLGWAGELGIHIGEAVAATAPEAAAPGEVGELCPDDVLRALMIKGLVNPDGLAVMLATTGEKVAPILDGLVAVRLAEMAAGSYRLTGEGRLKALEVFTADRGQAGGEEFCVASLDTFLEFDHRMKDLVTAWQVRGQGDQQTFNDHTDAAYDAAILDGLAALHVDVTGWLTPLIRRLARFTSYQGRLDHALASARGGDQKFVASPRVDSYHSVWFELHEDLIRLSGRLRSDEAAAGRA
jgi:pyruvate, orthophosphate dikinase